MNSKKNPTTPRGTITTVNVIVGWENLTITHRVM